MRISLRKAGVACGTAFASVALALSAAMPAGASSTAVVIGGVSAGKMSDLMMAPLLNGAFANEDRVNVEWPAEAGPRTGANDMTLGASINIGITNLSASIDAALASLDRDENGNVINGEKVTVVGLSAGSLVVDEVMRKMMAEGNLPDPSELTFILVEDSSRQELVKDSTYNSSLEYTYHTAPETPYNVIVITGEYDGFADFPDRPWNALAVANAMAGAALVHVPVMYYADLSKVPAENITVTVNANGGTTTHYLIPTTTLPLVQLNPALKSREAELRAKIDAGYSRNDPVSGTTPPPTTPVDPPVTPPVTTNPDPSSPAAQREARAEARAQARAEAAAKRQAKAEARAQARADAAAKREARAKARATAENSASTSDSSSGSGSSDSSGSSQ